MNARQGGFLISKIKNIGGRKFDKILQEKNIDAFNGAQGKILYVLWQNGKMTATEISKKSGLAKTTLSAMLTRMDEQGLIAMEESLTDKLQCLHIAYREGRRAQRGIRCSHARDRGHLL